ncbi:glycoside hydrolase family 3 N-terminal domain-containing protein [Fictibacillus aquaticus]|uniref:beta-glucosidase n=1 Tax=Fictibacillus aquaticus TaxID=2021314 RepID=A0A235FDD4_9BACL|nr:glycoside hydrolase family 3 N-terminal domain-containing protein [Fictibacillus aquaticus]OYD59321.1 beta-glucosidase [Fictibacillus aquaticus]
MTTNRIQSLLQQMTLEEKIAQLTQLATPFYKGASDGGQITGPMAELGITEEVVQNTGSVLGASGAKEVRSIQETHLKENRLGIPLLMMADIVHGFKTIFPVPLAIGCSWDTEEAERSAEIAAKEASVSGVHVTFAPMVDLVRDPRWGRVMESTGEDPYLNSEFARAFVRGFQGNNMTEETDRVAACVKHFAAYGAAEGGRDYNTVDMSERQLRESYLPAYKAALDEGCEMVMTAFNTVEGVPATGNRWLMRDLLREEIGFNGVLISDWGAVKEMIPHGVAEDEKEAARKAIEAGVDIEMMTSTYVHHVKELVEEGSLEVSLIDEAVIRILELKEKLGLFENPHRGADVEREQELIMHADHRKAAKELAVKSSVLLKNSGILPLKTEQKVALIGPFAQSGDILGPWSWQGSKEEAVQLYDGLLEKSSGIFVAKGSDIETGSEEMLNGALDAGEKADVIVLALGEHSDMSGEAGCRGDIRLPEVQLELLSTIKQLGKPIVVVLFNGRPLDLTGVVQECDAIVEAWYPGTEGGAALADLLYGDANFSGKLSMSFPHTVGQVPVYYNNYNTGRPQGAPDAQVRYVSQYLDIPNEPLYPFGYGLSYTTYEYSGLQISSETMTPDETLTISVDVKNTGSMAGEEIVQMYVRDMAGEVIRPLKELKDFEKLPLQPGDKKTVSFTLTEEQLRYHHINLTYKSDAGTFTVYAGPNSRDVQSATFTLLK